MSVRHIYTHPHITQEHSPMIITNIKTLARNVVTTIIIGVFAIASSAVAQTPLGSGIAKRGAPVIGKTAADGADGADATMLSGTAVMLTAEIAGNACAAAEVSSAAVGILATDVVAMSFQSDPSAVTGYGSGSADGLVIYGYPGADVALFKVCNVTATAITPAAITINWQVVN
jgi:hypothetical protein